MRLLILSFLLVTLVLSEEVIKRQYSCPNGCSGHGACTVANKCRCDNGFTGDDCSIPISPLASGKSQSGYVGVKQWMYYSIETSVSLIVIVNQTSSNGDCDIYLQKNQIPTRSNYAYRDISLNKDVQLTVENAGAATWFIGIYGFLNTNYLITASSGAGECADLNGCNGNGRCVNALCQCNQYYMQADCSVYAPPLVLNRAVSGRLESSDWQYYQITVTSSQMLRFTVNQLNSGDVDLYVRQNAIPTRTDYDFRDIGVVANYTLDIPQPAPNVIYYVGLRAFQGPISFTLIASQSAVCPANCSKHGTCTSGQVCVCGTAYSGQYCQTMTSPMSVNRWYPGYVVDETWNYFRYATSSSSSVVVTVRQAKSNGDCDLYVKAGSTPTTTSFDYRDIGVQQTFNLTFPNSGSTTWYFGVYGYSECDFNISVSLAMTCPGTPACSGHGICSTTTGVCSCASGWAGTDCSLALVPLSNGLSASGSTNLSRWSVFSFSPSLGSTSMQVNVKELSSVGSVWLYISQGRMPDTRSYDYTDQNTYDNTSPYHQLSVVWNNGITRNVTWYIGVYGNPFALGQLPFSIAAWSSPF